MNSSRRTSLFLIIAACLVFLLGTSVSYLVAALFSFPSEFGAPFHFLGVPLYPPFSFVSWYLQYSSDERFRDFEIVSIFLIFIFIGIVLGTLRVQAKKRREAITSFGSARFSTRKEMRASGLYGESGVILGTDKDGVLLRHDGPEHI